MTQEENPLGGLLGGVESALGTSTGTGAGTSASGHPIGELMGMLQSSPGAGAAQTGGPNIDASVVQGVLGMLGGGSKPASSPGGSANPAALLEQLKAGGLASEVESWIGSGANKPVTPEAIGQALGPQAVQQLSSNTGLSIQQLLPQLAALIPLLINHLTPNGNASSLTSGSSAEVVSGLQSLLGGLAKG